MRTRLTTMTVSAMTIAGALTLTAQSPQTPSSPQTQPQTQAPMDRRPPATDAQRTPPASAQTITIVGCLKPESDVPGLKPNVVERAGVTEDYILTDVKMAPSSPVSGLALADKYEVEGIAAAELKKHINHQVELTGTLTTPADARDTEAPDFHATSMKMVSATCSAPK